MNWLALMMLAALPLLRLNGGELSWDRTVIECAVEPNEPQIQTEYAFRNLSDHPVTITSVLTSCGCTVASVAQPSYAPGARGAVKVVFTPGSQSGKVTKTITVATAGSTEPTVLMLRANLHEPVTVAPRLVSWLAAEGPIEKRIVCTSDGSSPVEWVGATSGSDDFITRTEVAGGGKEFRIYVRPRPARAGNATFIAIRLRSKNGTLRQIDAEVCVACPSVDVGG